MMKRRLTENPLGIITIAIIVVLIAFILIINNLFDTSPSAQAIFGGTGVRVYNDPNSDSTLIGIIAQGTVDIHDVSEDGLWLEVPFRDTTGWVETSAVTINGELD